MGSFLKTELNLSWIDQIIKVLYANENPFLTTNCIWQFRIFQGFHRTDKAARYLNVLIAADCDFQ